MNNGCFEFLEELQRRILEQEKEGVVNIREFNIDNLNKTRVTKRDPETPTLITDQIKKVIYNDPATIIYWKDGSKTVVQVHNEPFDYEKGLLMAMFKKMHGNSGSFNDVLRDIIGGATVTPTAHPAEDTEQYVEVTESVVQEATENQETTENENPEIKEN